MKRSLVFALIVAAASPQFESASAEPYGYDAPAPHVGRPLDLRRRAATPESQALLTAEAGLAADEAADVEEGAALAASTVPFAPPEAASVPVLAQVVGEGVYVVQIGAYADPANAERVRAALCDVGPVFVEARQSAGRSLFRVRLGPWGSQAEANQARSQAAALGYRDAVVTTR